MTHFHFPLLQVLAAALFHHFKKPIMIVEGKGQYLFDERGRRFLDVRAAPNAEGICPCWAGARNYHQEFVFF